MISGQNTEVRHNQLSFHVQTEDKGRSNPFIESIVYLGGQVLVSKRTSYADVLAAGRGEKEVAALMDRQHRTMIAAILRGRFDQKVRRLGGTPKPTAAALPAESDLRPESRRNRARHQRSGSRACSRGRN